MLHTKSGGANVCRRQCYYMPTAVLLWSMAVLLSLAADVLQTVDEDGTNSDRTCFRRCSMLLLVGSPFLRIFLWHVGICYILIFSFATNVTWFCYYSIMFFATISSVMSPMRFSVIFSSEVFLLH
jgi:hypothetical protein